MADVLATPMDPLQQIINVHWGGFSIFFVTSSNDGACYINVEIINGEGDILHCDKSGDTLNEDGTVFTGFDGVGVNVTKFDERTIIRATTDTGNSLQGTVLNSKLDFSLVQWLKFQAREKLPKDVTVVGAASYYNYVSVSSINPAATLTPKGAGGDPFTPTKLEALVTLVADAFPPDGAITEKVLGALWRPPPSGDPGIPYNRYSQHEKAAKALGLPGYADVDSSPTVWSDSVLVIDGRNVVYPPVYIGDESSPWLATFGLPAGTYIMSSEDAFSQRYIPEILETYATYSWAQFTLRHPLGDNPPIYELQVVDGGGPVDWESSPPDTGTFLDFGFVDYVATLAEGAELSLVQFTSPPQPMIAGGPDAPGPTTGSTSGFYQQITGDPDAIPRQGQVYQNVSHTDVPSWIPMKDVTEWPDTKLQTPGPWPTWDEVITVPAWERVGTVTVPVAADKYKLEFRVGDFLREDSNTKGTNPDTGKPEAWRFARRNRATQAQSDSSPLGAWAPPFTVNDPDPDNVAASKARQRYWLETFGDLKFNEIVPDIP